MPRTATDTAVVVCALGIALCFFAPWITLDRNIGGYNLTGAAGLFWIIPPLAIATIVVHRNKVHLRNVGTITAVVVWMAALHWLLKSFSFGMPGLQWGASLSLMLSLGLFALVGENRLTATADFVARKLNSRKGELCAHWGGYMPNLHFSAREFYAKIEAEIRAKRWPDVQLLRVIYTEAGLLSHKREYLRVVRQRQCFDICAAPYGVDYFFSLRELVIPAVVTVRALLATTLGVLFLAVLLLQLLGLMLGVFLLLFLLGFGVWFLFNVLKLGLTKVDAALMKIPVLNAVYLTWFRKETFFEQDTCLIFTEGIDSVVKKHVDETLSASGIKFINKFERRPFLDGYKRSRTKLGGDDQPVTQ